LNYQRARFADSEAPYFIDMVKDYLGEKYGERTVYQGGLRVYTTIDLNMQKAANKAVLEGLKGKNKNLQAALVALDVENAQIEPWLGGPITMSPTTTGYTPIASRDQPSNRLYIPMP
jgi:penicillin-binding protein 1A